MSTIEKKYDSEENPGVLGPPAFSRSLLISFMLYLNSLSIINSFILQVRGLRGSEGGSAQGRSGGGWLE